MKILLFNDNPVVRKLVALSAQKTKDELSVVWSVEEVEEGSYDLVIIDDALYSDQMFASLKGAVNFKTALLMATRGNAVPAGFDHVINKPFLPTDLVDLFAKIDGEIGSKVDEKMIDLDQEPPLNPKKEAISSIDLEDEFLSIEPEAQEDFISAGAEGYGDDLAEEFSSLDEEEVFPAVLDHEEVQEVRGLLKDTEDEFPLNDDIAIQRGDDFEFDELETSAKNELPEDEELFDFEGLDFEDGIEKNVSERADIPLLDSDELMEQMNIDEMEFGDEKAPDTDELMLDDMLLADEEVLEDDETLSDAGFGDLELKIQEAVGDLEPEDLERELDDMESFDFEGLDLDEEGDMGTLTGAEISDMSLDEANEGMELEDEGLADENLFLPEDETFAALEDDLEEGFDESLLESLKADAEAMDTFSEGEGLEGFDELDMLDERELKRAMGEEVEEETETLESTHTAVSAEVEEYPDELSEPVSALTNATPTVEGVEALQTLLKALANEEVVKSLKGLNISININFGNDQ